MNLRPFRCWTWLTVPTPNSPALPCPERSTSPGTNVSCHKMLWALPLTKASFTWRGDQDALEKPDSSLILLWSKDMLFSKSQLPSPYEARLVRRNRHASSLPQWKITGRARQLEQLTSQRKTHKIQHVCNVGAGVKSSVRVTCVSPCIWNTPSSPWSQGGCEPNVFFSIHLSPMFWSLKNYIG